MGMNDSTVTTFENDCFYIKINANDLANALHSIIMPA
jgi:hypothetical protein